jgi:hypothetical protein
MSKCFTEDVRASWGKPGESGDAVEVLKAVDTLLGFCRAFKNWELDVCATEPPVKLRRLRDSFRGITGSVIGDIKRATDELGRAIEDVRGGSEELRVKLDFSIPPQLAKVIAEVNRINEHPERFVE